MTYLGFHARFSMPALVAVGVLVALAPLPPAWWASGSVVLCVLFVIVLAFTSPWDNAAVKWGTWDFPPDRVWFRIAYLPVEEYAFFLLQTAIVALLTIGLVSYSGGHPYVGSIHYSEGAAAATYLIGWFGVGTVLRKHSAFSKRFTYAWHLLYWFVPVVIVQWIIASEILVPHLRIVAASTLAVGTYFTVADVVAVRHGIWFFDERQITGTKLASVLPWEEVAFFYITSLLVAQSTLLLLPPFHSSG